jgi:acetyl esterase/lipase
LPWDDHADDDRMRLRHVGSLLPYHTHVDPATVVSALNHIIDDVNNGETVFYDFYTDEEKKQEAAKSNTGLFFFRGKPGAPFAVIAPGGGFSYVASVHEGFPYAVAISQQGDNAFVLRYRVGSGGADATRDLAAAISYVFRNAQTLGVRTEGYSLWGSSAGARMAAAIGSHGVAGFGGDVLPKPSAVVMARSSPDSRSARASARHSRRNQYRPSTESRCSFAPAGPFSTGAGWTMWNDSWRNASPRVRAGQLAIVSQVITAHIVLPH